MMNSENLTVKYDVNSDVLYISVRKAPAARGIEDSNGIVWRYDSNGEIIGATIVDFYDYWSPNSPQLADEISKHFHVAGAVAKGIVDKAIHQRFESR